MINVLPTATKRQLRAARTNVVLFRYCILLGAAVAFLILGVLSIYLVMGAIKTNAENITAQNRDKITNFAAVEAEASTLRSKLSTAKAVFDQEIIYSDTVLNISQIIPAGVTLDNLNLTAESFGSPITLSANAKSYQHAIALKQALEGSSLFSSVSFSSIATSTGDPDGYPYAVTINATLTKEAATR